MKNSCSIWFRTVVPNNLPVNYLENLVILVLVPRLKNRVIALYSPNTNRTTGGSYCLISVYNECLKIDYEHTMKSKINRTNNIIIMTASYNRIQSDSSFSNKVFSDGEPNIKFKIIKNEFSRLYPLIERI